MTSTLTIRPGRVEEAEALTALAMTSKAHWGYDAEFMARCRAELTVTAKDMAEEAILVAESEGRSLGFCCMSAVEGGEAGEAEIWNCFVDPAAMGQGIGRALVEGLIAEARRQGFRSLCMDADPYARGFYERMGFVYRCDVPSGSIPGRKLPQLAMVL